MQKKKNQYNKPRYFLHSEVHKAFNSDFSFILSLLSLSLYTVSFLNQSLHSPVFTTKVKNNNNQNCKTSSIKFFVGLLLFSGDKVRGFSSSFLTSLLFFFFLGNILVSCVLLVVMLIGFILFLLFFQRVLLYDLSIAGVVFQLLRYLICLIVLLGWFWFLGFYSVFVGFDCVSTVTLEFRERIVTDGYVNLWSYLFILCTVGLCELITS